MKRPVGVLLSAIGLGFTAAFTFLVAASMMFSAFMLRSAGATAVVHASPTPQPTPNVVFGISLAFSVVAAGIAVWEIITLVGLLRLRNWARYSVLVIGGLLTFLGACGVLGMVAMAFLLPDIMANAGQTQPPPPHVMQIILIAGGLFYGAIAAVGIFWLVYFNLARTRRYFITAYAIDPVFYAGEADDPQLYRGTGRIARTPTAVMVMAWLFIFSAVCCLLLSWVQMPAFLFGLILTGVWPHVLMLAFAVVAGLTGWGLMRLDNRARLAVYALIAYAIVNFSVMLSPWGRARYAAFNDAIYANMQIPVPRSPLNLTSLPFLLTMAAFCAVFYGIQIWILERHRLAFTAPPLEALPGTVPAP